MKYFHSFLRKSFSLYKENFQSAVNQNYLKSQLMNSELIKYYFGKSIYSFGALNIMHIFTIFSSLSEIEDFLPPGKAVFYTWADPVGSRKLKWSCGKSHGEVTQKDVCIGRLLRFSQKLFFFNMVFSFSLATFKSPTHEHNLHGFFLARDM